MIPFPTVFEDWREWASKIAQILESQENEGSKIPQAAKLPTASKTNRGKMVFVPNPGGDALYVCVWNGMDYQWNQLI